jgi:hypothetical protein
MADYHNDTDQKTRKAVVKNDTYMSRAAASVGEELGGRFKRHVPYDVKPVPQYPRLTSGPWSCDDGQGPEPPIGYDISAAPDIGYQETPADHSPVEAGVEAPTSASGRTGVGVETPPPLSPTKGDPATASNLPASDVVETGRHDQAQVVPSFSSAKPIRRL